MAGPLTLTTLLGELQRILEKQALGHTQSCTNGKCTFHSNGTKPSWLAQGTYNIVFCAAPAGTQVYRFGFFVYDSENRAKERVKWNEAMGTRRISACEKTEYKQLSADEVIDFIQRFKSSVSSIIDDYKKRGLQQICVARLTAERNDIIVKAEESERAFHTIVGHSLYLFREEAKYAPLGDLRAFLEHKSRTPEKRTEAWKAAYETIEKYTTLFEDMLTQNQMQRRDDAVLVDLKPSNFLVYTRHDSSRSNAEALDVVLGDAGFYEGYLNASASELSLRSLQLLSSLNKKKDPPLPMLLNKKKDRPLPMLLNKKKDRPLPMLLSLGVFVTLLANRMAGPDSSNDWQEAFQSGVKLLQDKLQEKAADLGPQQGKLDLLKKAVALVANLRFPPERGYPSFLDVLAHYVEPEGKSWIHEKDFSKFQAEGDKGLEALHDYSNPQPGALDMTAAAEQYTKLLYQVFACEQCGKPPSPDKESIKELFKTLQKRCENHRIPTWLRDAKNVSGLLSHYQRRFHNAKEKKKQAEEGDRSPRVFWDEGKESKRTNIVTFFSIAGCQSMDQAENYWKWSYFLCLHKIGASETRTMSAIKSHWSDRYIKWNGKPSPNFLFCYTQPDDEGLLANIWAGEEKNRDFLAKAWAQLWALMRRYADALWSFSASTAEEAADVPFFYFNPWDPQDVAVYRFGFGNKTLVRVRLLEPRLLAKGKPLSIWRKDLHTNMQTRGLKNATELALVFYLSLLTSGANLPCVATKDGIHTAMSPLLEQSTKNDTSIDWQRTLKVANHVAGNLSLTGGIHLLSDISNGFKGEGPTSIVESVSSILTLGLTHAPRPANTQTTNKTTTAKHEPRCGLPPPSLYMHAMYNPAIAGMAL